MKADLHVHSIYSHDAISKPESILSAAADRGIGIIALTDHDTAIGWKAIKALEPKYPVQVILGQEIKVYRNSQRVGELLGLFLHKPLQSKTIPQVIEEIHSQNGLVSIPHPFCERRGEFRGYEDINNLQQIAVEARNGRTYKERDNEMAAGFADRLQSMQTAGSDAHTPFEVGNVYLEFEGKTPQDLLHAIQNRDVKIGGSPSSSLFSLISGFGRFGIAI